LVLKVSLQSLRHRWLTVFWVTLLLGGWPAGCTSERQLLNSERIELRFGSYGVSVLRSDDQQRVSNLYSEEIDGDICRTYAIVDFVLPLDSRLAAEHSAIIAGGSIGEVFRQAGWQTDKYTLSIAETDATEYSGQIAALMKVGPTVPLALHRYRFDAVRGELHIPYAVITEIHHPDYLTVRQLHDIYD
jgi:hypothetical protein